MVVNKPVRLTISYISPSSITTLAPVVEIPRDGYYCLVPPTTVHGLWLLPEEMGGDQDWRRHLVWLEVRGTWLPRGRYYVLGPFAAYRWDNSALDADPSSEWTTWRTTIAPGRRDNVASIFVVRTLSSLSTTTDYDSTQAMYLYYPGVGERGATYPAAHGTGITYAARNTNSYWEARVALSWYDEDNILWIGHTSSWARYSSAYYIAHALPEGALRLVVNYRTTDPTTPNEATADSVMVVLEIEP